MDLDEALRYADGVRRPGAEGEAEFAVLALTSGVEEGRVQIKILQQAVVHYREMLDDLMKTAVVTRKRLEADVAEARGGVERLQAIEGRASDVLRYEVPRFELVLDEAGAEEMLLWVMTGK